MVQESPSDSTTPPAQGRRLGAGAIASLSGLGLLVIFMIQNTERVRQPGQRRPDVAIGEPGYTSTAACSLCAGFVLGL